MCDDEQARTPQRSKFQTEGAATLKPREAKVVRTRGTDNRLVLEERRERAERAEVSRLRLPNPVSL